MNVIRLRDTPNPYEKLPFPVSPRANVGSATDLQAFGVDELHNEQSEIIMSNGVVRYPRSMEKFVDRAIDSLKSKKYKDTVTEPITLNTLFSDDPIPELPHVEIVPIQRGMQRLKIRRDNKDIERIGCSSDATVYADGVEQSAVHALAHVFIDIVAQAHARRYESSAEEQLVSEMHSMRLSPSKIRLDESGELPPETRVRIEALEPFRRCYTDPQVQAIARRSIESARSAEPIRSGFRLHDSGTLDELYDQPVDTVPKSVDLKNKRLKEFEKGLAAERNSRVRIPRTNKVAFHYQAEAADRTEPSALDGEERKTWDNSLAAARESFGNASWLQSQLFVNDYMVRSESDVDHTNEHMKTRFAENQGALADAKRLLETAQSKRSERGESHQLSFDDEGALQRLMAHQAKRPRQF